MKTKLLKNLLLATLISFSINGMGQTKRDLKQEEKNKKTVSAFYQGLFGDKEVSFIDTYIAENYIQHNPQVADGRKALKDGATQWFEGAPKEKIDIQHIAADGDLVFIHLKSKDYSGKTISVIDIFKLKNNKIVEHWDVIQKVPDNAANSHPMF